MKLFAKHDQRTKAAIVVAAGWVAAFLFPPFAVFHQQKIDCGYNFLWERPHSSWGANACTVDIGLLVIEFAVILAIGACVWVWRPNHSHEEQ